MSDWTDEIQAYIERAYESLAEEFIEKHEDEWYEFCSEKFFKLNLGEMSGLNEDRD